MPDDRKGLMLQASEPPAQHLEAMQNNHGVVLVVSRPIEDLRLLAALEAAHVPIVVGELAKPPEEPELPDLQALAEQIARDSFARVPREQDKSWYRRFERKTKGR